VPIPAAQPRVASMAETTRSKMGFLRFDRVLGGILLGYGAIAALIPAIFIETVLFTANAMGTTAPFIIFAVLAIAYLKATGVESLVASAFKGANLRMIVFASLLGGLSPFCSCEVIPFIAALLAVGTPLSAVMAFWLSSPLMDPAMFAITSGTLGFDFAIAKTIAAVGLGLFGGLATLALSNTAVFIDPLREKRDASGCAGAKASFEGKPMWRFWDDADRRVIFRDVAFENALFLFKWLVLAYTIEALMIRYIPAEWIAQILGGEGVGTIVLAALIGAPAYLNGYAAVPLVDALMTQGMSAGAALSFMVSGGVSSIPAAIAVWALVKWRVFVAYLGLAFVGSSLAGLLWQMLN